MFERTNDLLEEKGEDFKFAPDFDNGIVFEHTDVHKKTMMLKTISPSERPREATINIFSFLGSLDAVHYYVTINLGRLEYVFVSNGKPYHYYVNGHSLPFGATKIEMEVTRKVDRRDLDHDKHCFEMQPGSFIYGRMKKRDYTHGWWSKEEALEGAINFFKKHFEPGWILLPSRWEEDERPVYWRT